LIFVLAVLYSHFIQFPPLDIPYGLYHRETLWSNTEKTGKEMSLDTLRRGRPFGHDGEFEVIDNLVDYFMIFYERDDCHLASTGGAQQRINFTHAQHICLSVARMFHVLAEIHNRGILPLRFKSYYTASISDGALCTGCGTCVKYCPVGTISLSNERSSIQSGKCIGCGQCELQCPEGVISLEYMERDVVLPLQKRSEARITAAF